MRGIILLEYGQFFKIVNTQIVSWIEVDNATVTLSDIIFEQFNEYFTNIGPNLDKKNPDTTGDVIDYVKPIDMNDSQWYQCYN